MSDLPILYSFRRCPYAMRARMALIASGTNCEVREVKLAAKPPELLDASPKATVPVLVLPDGSVIDESIEIMRYALALSDPEGWLAGDAERWVETNDGPFKYHLDRYKYYTRHDTDPLEHRASALAILEELDRQLDGRANLCGEARTLADVALFPFVRQFANHDRDWYDALPLRNLHAWLKRHLDSGLFASAMTKRDIWKSGDAPVFLAD